MTFEEQKAYIKGNKRIDASKFGGITDITNMIDFLNNEVERKAKERGDEEIASISRFLERLAYQKTFLMKGK